MGWGCGLLPTVLSGPRVVMREAEAEVGAALELSGLPPHVPDELLILYFENRRRSGGGPVSSWQRFGRGGVLTFREPAGEGTDGRGGLGPRRWLGLTHSPPLPTGQTQSGSWPRRSTSYKALGSA